MLIKCYEATVPTTLYGAETFSSAGSGWYVKRHDCVVHQTQLGSTYKIYRDGRCVRVCSSQGYNYVQGFDNDRDKIFIIDFSLNIGGNHYNDPIGLKYDPNTECVFTPTGTSGLTTGTNGFIWKGNLYKIVGATITKYTLAGVSQGTFTVTGSITPFSADIVEITDDGTLIAIDFDNGTYGCVRFYDMSTGTSLHYSVFDRSKRAWVDRVNENIWSINLTSGMMQVWTFQVAPQNFSAITLGSNRSRYREDAASVILRGSVNEPCPFWPVAWSLSTSEGHLINTYSETDASGIATTAYCGPGATDYVGASQTIQVTTGY